MTFFKHCQRKFNTFMYWFVTFQSIKDDIGAPKDIISDDCIYSIKKAPFRSVRQKVKMPLRSVIK